LTINNDYGKRTPKTQTHPAFDQMFMVADLQAGRSGFNPLPYRLKQAAGRENEGQGIAGQGQQNKFFHDGATG
jgi:hypothetical protein